MAQYLCSIHERIVLGTYGSLKRYDSKERFIHFENMRILSLFLAQTQKHAYKILFIYLTERLIMFHI